MRHVAAVLSALLLSVILASAAHADRRVALVIGNATYANTAPLNNPINDADDVAAVLTRLGFKVVQGRDLDKRSMERTVRQFGIELAGAEVALFFYAGHGLQVGGQNYLVPTDARLSSESDVDFESVPLALVLRQMEREAKTSIILLDACRDNPLGRNLARTMGTRSAQVGQGLAEVKTGVGTLIGFSTQPGSIALDGNGRNSPYAGALLNHMEVPGKELSAVLVAVRNDVLKATGGRQVPWEHTSLTGQVFLRDEPGLVVGSTTPARSEPSARDYDKEMEITYWNSVKESKSVAPLQAYLDRYPEGTFAGLARVMIADMAQKSAGATQDRAKVASQEPSAGRTPQTLAAEYPEALARALRKELDRVGCRPGSTDGRWDDQAKKALAEFSRVAKVSLPTDAPTVAALEAVTARRERICTLKCGKGETENDGRCVAESRNKPEGSRRVPQAGRHKPEGPAGNRLCWSQEGRGFSVSACAR